MPTHLTRQVYVRAAPIVIAFGIACAICGNAFAQPVSEPYHVGVWFFSIWNSDTNGFQIKDGQALYGRADPWAGTRDYAEGHGAFPVVDPDTGKPVNFASREPLLGYYDLMSRATVDSEIEEAASEGIDFFAFYWYFDSLTGKANPACAPIPKFFASPVRDKMKYALTMIATGEKDGGLKLDTWRSIVEPQIVNYMASPVYYRVNGRPLLFDFGWPMENRAQAYIDLRQDCVRRFGAEPLIIYVLCNTKYGGMEYNLAHLHPDGYTNFHFSISRPVEPYSEMTKVWMDEMKEVIAPPGGEPAATLTYIPTGSVGQDPRPWYGVGYPKAYATTIKTHPYTVGTTPKAFEHHLRDLKALVDSKKVNTLNTLVLYAWNEWGEAAAAIEPSRVDGYAYSDAVRRVFGLIPRCSRPVAAASSPTR